MKATLQDQRAHNDAAQRRYESWLTRERMAEAARRSAREPEMPPTGRGPTSVPPEDE
jgi:hypothetical protein